MRSLGIKWAQIGAFGARNWTLVCAMESRSKRKREPRITGIGGRSDTRQWQDRSALMIPDSQQNCKPAHPDRAALYLSANPTLSTLLNECSIHHLYHPRFLIDRR